MYLLLSFVYSLKLPTLPPLEISDVTFLLKNIQVGQSSIQFLAVYIITESIQSWKRNQFIFIFNLIFISRETYETDAVLQDIV